MAAAIACLLVLAGGCRSLPGAASVRSLLWPWGSAGEEFTEADLREDVSAYAARFSATVSATADEIRAASTDAERKRRALLWKIRIVPIAGEAAFISDPERAYVALFALAIAQRAYLVSGAGGRVFGDAQDLAATVSEELVTEARKIGTRFLTPAQQAQLDEQVTALATQHPIRGIFVPETVQAAVDATAPGGSFDWMISLPLAPFRALEGVDAGAQAIREFNATAQSFTRIVADLPQHLRWNAELFSYELEQQPAVESVRASLDSTARSADVFAQAVAGLPVALREQAASLFDQIEAGQRELQRTLAEARGLAGDAGVAGERLTPLAQSLERAAAQVQQAGDAWTALVEQARAPGPPPPPGAPPARPFDITEYARAAEQVTLAATETRALLADVRTLGGGEEIAPGFGRLEQALGRVEGGGRSLVNLAAWRILELMLAAFVLVFAYRRIEARLARAAHGGRT